MQKVQAEAMLKSSEQLAALARDRLRIGNGDEYDVALAAGQRREPARHGAQPRPRLRQRTARTRNTRRALPRAAAVAVAATLPAWPGTSRPDCPPSCSSDVPTWSRRSAAWPPRSIASRRRKPRACRASRCAASFTSISSELFVLQSRDNPLFSFGAGLAAAALPRRPAAGASGGAHGGAAGGDRRLRQGRRARVRRGRGTRSRRVAPPATASRS